MPFVNSAQKRACFAQYSRDVKNGRIPAWDCYEWSKRSIKKSKGKRSKRSIKKRSRKLSPKRSKRVRKVHTGPNGGKYVIFRGRKVYV